MSVVRQDPATVEGVPAEDPTYTMTVELSVLESLGINLYSNAAAVLSELVANAYDADATNVDIRWESSGEASSDNAGLEQIVVSDNGQGMGVDEINGRFLKAGYKKRETEGSRSAKWKRLFMGRKGIGKLSVFSLARVVEVYSKTENGQAHGLRINVADLETCIKKEQNYHPQPVNVPDEYDKKGTTLVLSELKRKRATITARALRKRLARRFDVLDETPEENGGFRICVNGERITWEDRQELKNLQFIWEFGEKRLPDSALPSDITRFVLKDDTADGDENWKVSGWFGTTKKPADLTDDEEAGSLKNIIVLARKRPIQEGIVEKLNFARLFANYVTGQIEADFLDLDDPNYEDIATSDRQRLMEDDERVIALQDLLKKAFDKASEEWGSARPKQEAARVLKVQPALKGWIDDLEPWQRKDAERMIGTIASLHLDGRDASEARRTLYKSGILAFERIGLRKNADDLERLSTAVSAEQLLPLLARQDAYEAALWSDILKSRVEAIEKLAKITDQNEKERVLQEHLFDHLWLLDASWERATEDVHMEQNLRKIDKDSFPGDPNDPSTEIKGRIDVRYRTINGKHVIVELKRYDVKAKIEDLVEQGMKYYEALEMILKQQQRDSESIEVVFVLGNQPRVTRSGAKTEPEFIKDQLSNCNASIRTYDSLITSARNQYDEYLQASRKAKKLDRLLSTLTHSQNTQASPERDRTV